MVTYNGYGVKTPTPKFENASALKQNIESNPSVYDLSNYNQLLLSNVQPTTGTEAIAQATDSITIGQIGKTELTLLLAGDADNASTTGITYTLVYKDSEGVEHTAVGTGTASLNGTPVAFVPAVADYYCTISFTASAVDANVNVYAATAAIAAIYATISTAATTSTEAQMLGVGAVYGRTHTNHNDSDGAILYLDYSTPWGETKKGALCTIDTTDGTTEIRFFESDGTTTVKDYFQTVSLGCLVTYPPTGNTHEYFLTDAVLANVDGSGNDAYGVIIEGAIQSSNLTYTCPKGWDAYLVELNAFAITGNAIGDGYVINIYHTPKGESYEKVFPIHFSGCIKCPAIFSIKEETTLQIKIYDTVGSTQMTVLLAIIEVKRS